METQSAFLCCGRRNGQSLCLPRGCQSRRRRVTPSYRQEDQSEILFITSGIPGSVGSATVALWRELGPFLEQQREFGIWPFEGDLATLCHTHPITLAETYPRAVYATALLDEVGACRPTLILAKKNVEVRRSAIEALTNGVWVRKQAVQIQDLDHAQNSEDDFDACLTTAALLRCQLENLRLCEPQLPNETIEGGILGTGSIDLNLKECSWPASKPSSRLGASS